MSGHWESDNGPLDPNSSLLNCTWVACIQAPGADNPMYTLIYNDTRYDYNETEVEFGDQVEYYCFNGMKGKDDFDFTFLNGTCLPGNQWNAPSTWIECTDSKKAGNNQRGRSLIDFFPAKWCPTPPDAVTDGTVYVNSTGTRFGTVCVGTAEAGATMEEMDPMPSCPWATVRYR